jgi:hypothetical protein
MITSSITPWSNTFTLTVPDDYVGELLEVVVYKPTKSRSKSIESDITDFEGTLSSDEADAYHKYLKQARSEWDRDIWLTAT